MSVDPAPSATRALRYVALGDSYTIGTSVRQADRWPNQLVTALGGDPPRLELVANLGVNGFRSGDLIRAELPALAALDPEFVTVQIGVNDVVRGVSAASYEANLMTILEELSVRLPANRIVTVATPNYTATAAGADYGDPRRQHDGIVACNAIMARLASSRGISYVDVFDLSFQAAVDRALVAGDGLHPSGAQYATWVERIAPVVAALLTT